MEGEVRKGREQVPSFLLIFASFPPHHHHFCSALLRHCLDPTKKKKYRQLNYHSVQTCMPASALMFSFPSNMGMLGSVCTFPRHVYLCAVGVALPLPPLSPQSIKIVSSCP